MDSIHAALWSNNTCPTKFRDGGDNVCKNDPDIGEHLMIMTNSGSGADELWFVVGGASSIDTGDFKLSWRRRGGGYSVATAAPTEPTSKPT